MIELIHGDCLEKMRDIQDKSIDMILTDPTYLNVKGGMKSKKFNVGKMEKNSFINTKMNDFDERQITKFLNEIKRLFKKSFNGYFFYQKIKKYKQGNQTVHPTEKPMKLIEELLLLSSDKNDTVLDCFMGSGTTGVACLNTKPKQASERKLIEAAHVWAAHHGIILQE